MSDQTPPKAGGLWARLFGMTPEQEAADKAKAEQAKAPPAPAEPAKPEPAKPAPAQAAPAKPEPPPPPAAPLPADSPAMALAAAAAGQAAVAEEEPVVVEEDDDTYIQEAPPAIAPPRAIAPPPPEPPAAPAACPACAAPRQAGLSFCGDCGYVFPEGEAPVAKGPAPRGAATAPQPARASAMPAPNVRIRNRYEVRELLSERQGICRYKGIDHQAGGQPVIIVWAHQAEAANPFEDIPVAQPADDDIMPTFDDAVPIANLVDPSGAAMLWPSLKWEKAVLEKANHPSLPQVVEFFEENNFEYLICRIPAGMPLWNAYDEDEAREAAVRYGWLKNIAEGLHALHQAGAMVEGIRPNLITVAAGRAVITDLTDLLPIPLPPNPPIKATLYTAPELILSPTEADARADLYSFGAMIYALEYLTHDLEEKDFERQFTPLQIVNKNPDVHPLVLRLINKTFVRDLNSRFPTDEAIKTDPSGFQELIKTLDVCARVYDLCRLDVAAWTTIGMIRTGNEDAFTFLHGCDSRQDELHEYAMVLLADGMGGYEAGEIAAAMALNELRKYLLAQPIFAGLVGKDPPPGPVNPETYKQVMLASLKHANKEVHTASRIPGKGKRGMGCTAEAVYVDSRHVIVGHVGDSRTYHLSQGRLIQLTRDQTLVNRLVELGQLTAEEAEDHPRKNELQQAIGGQPDVNPGIYHGKLRRGDWVLVCSDGLTNHIPAADLEKMLAREAVCAEEAARRLLNLVNLRGATDNATLVVVRAC